MKLFVAHGESLGTLSCWTLPRRLLHRCLSWEWHINSWWGVVNVWGVVCLEPQLFYVMNVPWCASMCACGSALLPQWGTLVLPGKMLARTARINFQTPWQWTSLDLSIEQHWALTPSHMTAQRIQAARSLLLGLILAHYMVAHFAAHPCVLCGKVLLR